MTDAEDIENQARKAIDQYLASVTYPVIYSNGDNIFTLGTAVLFQHGDRHFLLTAKHLFDEFPGNRFPYEGLVGPIGRGRAAPTELGNIVIHEPKGEDGAFLDIIAIELLEETLIQAIKLIWTFITVADFALPNPDSVYFVSGFPKEKERKFGENIGAALMTIATPQCESVPNLASRYDERYDLFCKYNREAADSYAGNKLTLAPWVGGVSGGPLFRVADDRPEIWTPKTGIRFVGIQSSASTGKEWLRAKNVRAIAKYFEIAIPEIGLAISKHFGS